MAQHVSEVPAIPHPRCPGALVGRRPIWSEVSLDAISHNLGVIRGRLGATRRVIAVVKANAYGHGAVPVARRLEGDGVDLIGVAFPEEGLELRRAGIRAPILVLGASSPDQLPQMRASSLIPTAYGTASVAAILAESARPGAPFAFHLKVDTGMGRLGVQPDEIPGTLERVGRARDRAALDGVFTTLSCADDPGDPHTASQVAVFESVVSRLREAGFTPSYVHAANSGGVLDHPPAWLDTVRPGIMLYGIHPSDRSRRMDLRPALSFKGCLALLKRVPAGTPVGYGRAFITRRPSVIGTVPAGYADGLSRCIAERGHTLVLGHRAPFAGRISMDHFMIDLTDIQEAAEGDQVVMIGRQGNAVLSAEQVAAWSDTIPYEILCRIGPRVPRLYDRVDLQDIL